MKGRNTRNRNGVMVAYQDQSWRREFEAHSLLFFSERRQKNGIKMDKGETVD